MKRKLDRPFAPGVLRQAEAAAESYRLILEPHAEVGYLGRVLEMPGVMADGATPEACARELRAALVAAVGTLVEQRRPLPAPSSERRRTAQVNIRMTEDEKLLLEGFARREGFRGVSDYIRTRALANVK